MWVDFKHLKKADKKLPQGNKQDQTTREKDNKKNNQPTKASKREPLSKNNNADNQRVLPWEDIIPPKS